MTGEVNFSGKIAKKIKLEDITVQDMSAEKKGKLDAIFDTKHDGDSKDALTVDELTKSVAEIDTNKDGKLSDAEMTAAWEALDNSKKQGIEKTDYVAYLKAMAAKNVEKATGDNIGNGYTIQLGEQLDDLVLRVLKSQGVSEPTDEQKAQCRSAIVANNPQSMKMEGGNVKWLIAGTKIYVPTDTTTASAKKTVKDQDNYDTVIERYNKWRNGEIRNFTYRVDDAGNQYEVRAGQDDVKYGTVTGGVIAGSNSDNDDVVANTNLKDAVDIEKLPEGDARNLTEIALQRFEWMKDETKIKKVENHGQDNPPYVEIEMNGGENQGSLFVKAYYDENKSITKYQLNMYGNVESTITLEKNGKLTVNKSGQDTVANHGVTDFGIIESFIKSNAKVRETMGLPKREFVETSMITDRDLNGNDRTTVEGKVKSASEIIAKLEISSDIKEIKTENKTDHKETVITLKDGEVVTAYSDNSGNVYKVNVKRNEDNVDVIFDLKDDENKITVNLGGNAKVEAYDAIKDVEAIKQFIKESKTTDGTVASAAALPYNVNHYMSEGEELGRRLCDQVTGSSRASTTRTVLKPISKQNIVGVIEKFNEIAKMRIIKYLDSESGITGYDIRYNIIGPLIHCAEEYSMQDTDEYKDLKYYYDKYTSWDKEDVDDPDFAERADRALIALKDKIKQVAKEKGEADKKSEVTASYRIRDYKVSGEELGHKLYKQVKGSSSSSTTKGVLREIKDEDVYYVIQQFNLDSPKEHIIKYLVNESGIEYRNLTFVLSSAINCASGYGLENTEEFRTVKAYRDFCFDNTEDPDDEDWAERVDTALENLMKKVKEQAATRGESL